MFREGQRLRAQFGDDAVVDLSLGQPLQAGEAVAAAFRAAAAERFPARFEYMPNLGYDEVRERTAADVDHPGVDVGCIAMTPGAAAACCVALRTFVQPGDDVIGVAPYFGEYRLYTETAGARFVPVGVRHDMTLDLEATAAALGRSTAAVLLNSPGNPTGHVLQQQELRDLAALLNAHRERTGRRVLLIVDEVYRRLLYPPQRYVDPLAHYEHTVLARSFSKDLGIAGERIGYLVMHPQLAGDTVRQGLELSMRALGFVNAPATAQRMLLHLDDWSIDISPYQERRDLAVGCAAEAGLRFVEPQGGLYLWLDSVWSDTLELVMRLAEQRVIVVPGIAFGSPGQVRLCFSYAPAKIRAAIDAIASLAPART
jgi:aspartate aminotransferase